MVGVGVGVEGGHQLDPEFPDQREVASVLLEHRIDEQPLAGGHIGEQIGEGAGGGIEQLPQQQRAAPCSSGKHGLGLGHVDTRAFGSL